MSPEMASTTPSTLMVLSVRTLEHQTKPVTVSRDASVLDLKHAVQVAFHVESNRQRLIFQGKMMKDGQSLAEYANLDTGKVVHLVVRPPDVPQNPRNDVPPTQQQQQQQQRQQNPSMRTFARGIPLPRFPFGRSSLPMVEGYTFITLDVGNDGATQPFSSLMDGLSGSLFPPSATSPPSPVTSPQSRAHLHDTSPQSTTLSSQNGNSSSNTNSLPTLQRPPFEFNLRPRISASDFGFLGATAGSDTRMSPSSQLPASVEVRLMRTMSCIRNVRTILDTPTDQSVTGIATTSTTSPEQARDIRARLRSFGNSQPAAVGMVLDELATLMTDVVPRLRDMTEVLRERDQALESEGNTDTYRRVLRTARVIQGISLISHFLGSVLAAAEVSPWGSSTSTTNRPDSRSEPNRPRTTAAMETAPATGLQPTNQRSGSPSGQPPHSQSSRSPSNGDSSRQQEQHRGIKRPNDDDGACSQQKKRKG